MAIYRELFSGHYDFSNIFLTEADPPVAENKSSFLILLFSIVLYFYSIF